MKGMKYLAGPLVALAAITGAQAAAPDAHTSIGNSLGIIGQYTEDSLTTYYSSLTSVSSFWQKLQDAYSAYGLSTVASYFGATPSTSSLIGGRGKTAWDATLSFTATSLSLTKEFSNNTVADSGFTTQSYSVPGPIAAAGLPGVLALMGFAAWKRRRAA